MTEGAVRPLRIAVVGAASASEEEYGLARDLGGALARRGAVVICGGHGGVMEGVARGASEAGGITVGLLRTADPDDANAWITLPLATGLGEARNALVAGSAEAMVAVGGAWGTLTEVAFARKRGVEVAVLGSSAVHGLALPLLDGPEVAAEWAIRSARRNRGEMPPGG